MHELTILNTKAGTCVLQLEHQLFHRSMDFAKEDRLRRNRASAKRCRERKKSEQQLKEKRLKILEDKNRRLVEDNKRLQLLLAELMDKTMEDKAGLCLKTIPFKETSDESAVCSIVDGFFC